MRRAYLLLRIVHQKIVAQFHAINFRILPRHRHLYKTRPTSVGGGEYRLPAPMLRGNYNVIGEASFRQIAVESIDGVFAYTLESLEAAYLHDRTDAEMFLAAGVQSSLLVRKEIGELARTLASVLSDHDVVRTEVLATTHVFVSREFSKDSDLFRTNLQNTCDALVYGGKIRSRCNDDAAKMMGAVISAARSAICPWREQLSHLESMHPSPAALSYMLYGYAKRLGKDADSAVDSALSLVAKAAPYRFTQHQRESQASDIEAAAITLLAALPHATDATNEARVTMAMRLGGAMAYQVVVRHAEHDHARALDLYSKVLHTLQSVSTDTHCSLFRKHAASEFLHTWSGVRQIIFGDAVEATPHGGRKKKSKWQTLRIAESLPPQSHPTGS